MIILVDIQYNMKKITLFLFVVIASQVLFSQQSDFLHCGHTQATKELYAKHPELKPHALQLQQQSNSHVTAAKTTTSTIVIPIVFHVMHQYGSENISDAQVQDAVRILNEDYQLRNADTSTIVSSFKNLKGNVNIEFRLAKIDPSGNCTNGIVHVYTPLTNQADDGVKFDQWDPSKYLNVWTVKTIGSEGVAGYAYYPSSADGWPQIDGVIILSNYIGSIGTGMYGTARALTHEIGHYLNLAHTWGDTNQPGVACGDDGVTDTPETIGWSSCNLTANTCNPPIIENVQNYMEYAYCSRMFTIGQVQRMTAALNSSVANRNNLWSASNLLATGTDDASFANTGICKPIADFTSNYTGVCENNSVTYTDLSSNGSATTWQWTFSGGTPSVSTSQNPTVTYPNAGVYQVKFKSSNTQGSDSITKTSYITIKPNSSSLYNLNEGFENITIPNADWILKNGSDNYNWQIYPVGASGTKSIKLNNFYATSGDIDEIIAPSIHLGSSTYTLTFKLAFAQKATDNTDKLRVLVSKNCGATWSQNYSKTGSALSTNGGTTVGGIYTPNASQWRTETVVVPYIFVGPNTTFKFEFTSGGGNNIYIDDVNLNIPESVEEFEKFGFGLDIYPNPASNKLNLIIQTQKTTTGYYELYDVIGKRIKQTSFENLSSGNNQLEINTGDLNKGLYFLNVTINGNTISKKIIIE